MLQAFKYVNISIVDSNVCIQHDTLLYLSILNAYGVTKIAQTLFITVITDGMFDFFVCSHPWCFSKLVHLFRLCLQDCSFKYCLVISYSMKVQWSYSMKHKWWRRVIQYFKLRLCFFWFYYLYVYTTSKVKQMHIYIYIYR